MTDQTIGFIFGAQTGGLDAGAAEVKSQLSGIQGAVARLQAWFGSLGNSARAGLGAIGGMVSSGAKGFTELDEKAGQLAGSIRGGLIPGFQELGEAIAAALALKAIADFTKQMGDTAEQARNQALTFGTTVGEIQRFNAQMTILGVNQEAAQTAMLRTSRNLTLAREGSKQQADAFREIGVNVHAAMSPMEAFQRTVEGLSKIHDQPTKIGLAFQLMGRNIAGVAPLLGITKEQMEAANVAVDESGAVDTVAWQKAMALAEANNQLTVAGRGLQNVLADALAPALTVVVKGITQAIEGFVRSYKEGGAAKTVMEVLSGTLKFLASILAGLAEGFSIFAHQINAVWIIVKGFAAVILDVLVGAVMAAVDAFGMLGRVLGDVFSGHFDRAVSDAAAGVRKIGDDALGTMHKVAADAKRAGTESARNFQGGVDDWNKGHKFMKDLWLGSGEPLPKPPPGGGGSLEDMQQSTKKPKKSGEESELDKLKEQLETLENQHNDTIQDMTAVELAFWQKVAAGPEMLTLKHKEQAEVRMTILRLEHQEAMKAIEDEIAAKRDADRRATADITEEAARRKAAIEQEVKDVQDAEKRKEVSHADATAKIDALFAEERQAAIDAANAIYAVHAATDDAIKAKADQTTSEYKQAQRDETDAAIARDKAILAANDAFTAQIDARAREAADEYKRNWDSVVDPLVSKFTSGLEDMAKGTRTFGQFLMGMGDQILNDWISKVVNPMIEKWLWGETTKTAATTAGSTARATAENTGFFATMTAKLAALLGIHIGHEAAKTAATGAGVAARTGIENAGFFAQLITKLAALLGIHIGSEAAKTAATVTGATARAAASKVAAAAELGPLVALAGAGGVASMAAAPFPIDLGAPAFGAAMAAAASGFGAAALAEGGGVVPWDQSPLVQTHPDEWILPSKIAGGLNDLISGGSIGGRANYGAMVSNAQQGASGGDTHLHYRPNITNPEADLMRMLDKQGHQMVDWVNKQVRAGRIGPGRARA